MQGGFNFFFEFTYPLLGFLAAITDWFVLKLIGKVNGTENLSIAVSFFLKNGFHFFFKKILLL